jgi:hypothetical protein
LFLYVCVCDWIKKSMVATTVYDPLGE